MRSLLKAIAAADPAPGAGAAAGVALALGASCAAKAATLSLRHRPDDPYLAAARGKLDALMAAALDCAARDGERFSAWLARRGEPEVRSLMQAEQELLRLAQALDAAVSGLRDHADPSLQGDLDAAGSLTRAARSIQARNLRETQRAAADA